MFSPRRIAWSVFGVSAPRSHNADVRGRYVGMFESSEGLFRIGFDRPIGRQACPSRIAVARAAYSNPATTLRRTVSRHCDVFLATSEADSMSSLMTRSSCGSSLEAVTSVQSRLRGTRLAAPAYGRPSDCGSP
jgi:hypothetical protein